MRSYRHSPGPGWMGKDKVRGVPVVAIVVLAFVAVVVAAAEAAFEDDDDVGGWSRNRRRNDIMGWRGGEAWCARRRVD